MEPVALGLARRHPDEILAFISQVARSLLDFGLEILALGLEILALGLEILALGLEILALGI
jgi:hypothetical protein